jgi:PAP_fibrillin
LTAVSRTGNGKTATLEQQQNVLRLVRKLETTSPPPIDLLTNPTAAANRQLIDGIWYLQYTSPSELDASIEFPDAWTPQYASEGRANIETQRFAAKGTVSAAGVTVDTSNRVVRQIFHVVNSTVVNTVTTELFGRPAQIIVAGTFRPSDRVPNRAVVAFDTARIEFGALITGDGGDGNSAAAESGSSTSSSFSRWFQIDLSFVFALLALVRRSNDNGWLETTYVDDRIRLGRGNKGTLFVLTRDRDAVLP